MRSFTAAALALAAPLAVSAIEFTSPSMNSTVTKGSSYELTWDTVDTDPSSFSVYLVNFVNWPPSYTLLAQDIETAAGAVSVEVPCVASSYGYQFNAINGTNVYVIYAQTPKFSVSGADCADTTVPGSPSTCAPPATVTVTVSKTLIPSNSTATATGSGGVSAAAQITPTPVASGSSSVPVFQGTCPDTIGWSSGYHHPVTLTLPPRAPNAPEVTKAPSKGTFNAVEGDDDDEEDVTSTIYRTTYLPLSLAPTACNC